MVTTTPWVNGLLVDAVAGSPTFAGIALQLVNSNVVATVEPAIKMQTGLSGCTIFITRTVYRRYVRIYFDATLPRARAISIVGHELRHVLEIAAHPEVIDQESLRALYAAVGHGRGDRWESDGAIEAGRTILREITSPAPVVAGIADDRR